MEVTKKVLSVSYGTFSCKLEGFDDSVTVLKSVAGYFRDLASEDRYFGAEPPHPDMKAIERAVSRASQKSVRAYSEDGELVVRSLSDLSTSIEDAELSFQDDDPSEPGPNAPADFGQYSTEELERILRFDEDFEDVEIEDQQQIETSNEVEADKENDERAVTGSTDEESQPDSEGEQARLEAAQEQAQFLHEPSRDFLWESKNAPVTYPALGTLDIGDEEDEATVITTGGATLEDRIREAERKARKKVKKAEKKARKAAEQAEAEEAARQKTEAEAKAKAEEEARQKAEDEAKAKAEEEARQKAEAEAKAKAEEEAQQKAEAEAKAKAEEEARQKAEAEAKAKAEEEARRKAEAEAKAKAEEEARRKAEAKAEEEKRRAEEAKYAAAPASIAAAALNVEKVTQPGQQYSDPALIDEIGLTDITYKEVEFTEDLPEDQEADALSESLTQKLSAVRSVVGRASDAQGSADSVDDQKKNSEPADDVESTRLDVEAQAESADEENTASSQLTLAPEPEFEPVTDEAVIETFSIPNEEHDEQSGTKTDDITFSDDDLLVLTPEIQTAEEDTSAESAPLILEAADEREASDLSERLILDDAIETPTPSADPVLVLSDPVETDGSTVKVQAAAPTALSDDEDMNPTFWSNAAATMSAAPVWLSGILGAQKKDGTSPTSALDEDSLGAVADRLAQTSEQKKRDVSDAGDISKVRAVYALKHDEAVKTTDAKPSDRNRTASQTHEPLPEAPLTLETPVQNTAPLTLKPEALSDKTAHATPAEPLEFAEYVAGTDTSSQTSKLLMAANYLVHERGARNFSRPQLLNLARALEPDAFDRETALKAFGRLMREGVFQRTTNGRFVFGAEADDASESLAG